MFVRGDVVKVLLLICLGVKYGRVVWLCDFLFWELNSLVLICEVVRLISMGLFWGVIKMLCGWILVWWIFC